jgi:hypothetical protein
MDFSSDEINRLYNDCKSIKVNILQKNKNNLIVRDKRIIITKCNEKKVKEVNKLKKELDKYSQLANLANLKNINSLEFKNNEVIKKIKFIDSLISRIQNTEFTEERIILTDSFIDVYSN